MKVSILVPVYGVEKFIERCAISLFEQTFQDIEFVFVNDCTPDDSINILNNTLERYPHRKSQVKIINHQINKGLAGARNTGVENAIGDYILHVDSDDYIDKNMVELMYQKAISDTADIVVCDFVMEWPKSILNVKQEINVNDKDNFLCLILSGQTMTCVWNKLIKRELYITNSIKTIEGVNLGEDFTVIPKLIFYAKKISKVDKFLYHYIQFNSESYTKKVNLKYIKNLEGVISLLELFFDDLDPKYKNSLLECKLRKKLELILKVDNELMSYVVNLYPETNTMKNDISLPMREKMTLFVLKSNKIFLIKMYSSCFNFMFNIYQKIKNR